MSFVNHGGFEDGIVELTAEELDAVFGGGTTVPQQTKPGTCPSGTTMTGAHYDGGGRLTGVDCAPTKSGLDTVKDKATGSMVGAVADAVVEGAKAAWDYFF